MAGNLVTPSGDAMPRDGGFSAMPADGDTPYSLSHGAPATAAPTSPAAKPRRPWYRLHASTWPVLALVLTFLLLVNLRGDQGSEFWSSDSVWEYGWPFTYLYQLEFHESGTFLVGCVAAWAQPTGWRLWALVADVLIAALVLVVVPGIWEWRRRRRNRFFQFTIADWMVAAAMVATVLGWWCQAAVTLAEEAKIWAQLGDHDVIQRSDCTPGWAKKLGIVRLPVFYRLTGAAIRAGERGDLPEKLRLLSSCEYLDWLHVEGLQPDDRESLQGLSKFRSVVYLTLLNTSLHGADLRTIAQVPRLHYLYVWLASTTANDLEPLRRANLRCLVIHSPSLGDDGLREISAWKSLRAVSVHAYEVTDEGVAKLAELPQLIEIRLSRCNVSGRGLSAFADHACLRTLHLADTQLDAEGWQAIAGIRSLETLRVGQRKERAVTSADITSLRSLPNLRSFSVRARLDARAKAELESLRRDFSVAVFEELGPNIQDDAEEESDGTEE